MEPEERWSSEEKNKGEINRREILEDLSKTEKLKVEMDGSGKAEILSPSPLLNNLSLNWDRRCVKGAQSPEESWKGLSPLRLPNFAPFALAVSPTTTTPTPVCTYSTFPLPSSTLKL